MVPGSSVRPSHPVPLQAFSGGAGPAHCSHSGLAIFNPKLWDCPELLLPGLPVAPGAQAASRAVDRPNPDREGLCFSRGQPPSVGWDDPGEGGRDSAFPGAGRPCREGCGPPSARAGALSCGALGFLAPTPPLACPVLLLLSCNALLQGPALSSQETALSSQGEPGISVLQSPVDAGPRAAQGPAPLSLGCHKD